MRGQEREGLRRCVPGSLSYFAEHKPGNTARRDLANKTVYCLVHVGESVVFRLCLWALTMQEIKVATAAKGLVPRLHP